MPVFDFSDTPKKEEEPQCTYTVYCSNEPAASPEKPMLVLDNSSRAWKHHSCGVFTNQAKRTAFEFKEEDGTVRADILQVDARFTSLLRWLGENHISVRLSGQNRGDGYAVYKIREVAFGGGTKLSAEDGFLQFMIERLLASSAPETELAEEDQEEVGDDMKLTSIQSHFDISDFIGRSLILQHDQMKAGDKREKMNIGVKKLYVLLQCFLEFVIVVLVHLAKGGIKYICIAKALVIAVVKSILQEIGPQGCFHIIFFLQLIKCHLQIQPPLLLQIRRFLCRHGKIQAAQWPYR